MKIEITKDAQEKLREMMGESKNTKPAFRISVEGIG